MRSIDIPSLESEILPLNLEGAVIEFFHPMKHVSFSDMDVAILYSVSKPGMKLSTLVWYFTFINRTAPPPYPQLQSCLLKAVQAGIVTVSGDGEYHVRVDNEWYDKIHQFDETSANEIDAMLRFEEGFGHPTEWQVVNAVSFTLTMEDYNRALREVERVAGRPLS